MFPLNLPNALTLIRILLVPVLVVALTVETPGGSAIAAIVFAIAAVLALIAANAPDAACMGAGTRLPDGRDHRRLGRGLFPQLPPQARGVRAAARAGRADGLVT